MITFLIFAGWELVYIANKLWGNPIELEIDLGSLLIVAFYFFTIVLGARTDFAIIKRINNA